MSPKGSYTPGQLGVEYYKQRRLASALQPTMSSSVPHLGVLAALCSFPPTEEWPSSPVGKVAKHFAEHKPEGDEVHAFGIDEDDHQLDSIAHFMDFLKIPADRLPPKTPKSTNRQLSFNNFFPAANTMAKSIRSQCECLLPLFLAYISADL